MAGSFALGVAASYVSGKGEAAVSARAPHPFFFARDRQVSGLAEGLSREEIGIHVQAQLLLAASESFTVTLFGGPSLINITEDLVADVRFRQRYPFEAASYDEALTQAQSGSGIGFNAGADLAYYFSDVAGVGLLVRYSQATVDLPSAGGGTVGRAGRRTARERRVANAVLTGRSPARTHRRPDADPSPERVRDHAAGRSHDSRSHDKW